jgi:Domain of unknown function (DUF5710)
MTGSDERLDLDVPFAEKDEAKRLGARWDPTARTWYVPPGVAREAFARWLPPPLPGGRLYPARLVLFPTVCWRSREDTTAIGGALVATRPSLGDVGSDLVPRGWAFFSFDTVADAVVQLIPAEQLAQQGVGQLKRRSSKTAGSSYLSNGCRECGALIGSHLLGEELLAAEKPFDRYPSIPLDLPEGLWTR